MAKIKKTAPTTTQQWRFRLAELFNDVENDDIDTGKAKVMVGAATAYSKFLSADLLYMQITGETKKIDELENGYERIKRQEGRNLLE